MGANIFSTQTGPNSASPDGVWGCRNTPTEGMPCVQTGTPYDKLWAAARSYHPGGVTTCFADGSVRSINNNVSLLTWQASAAGVVANRWVSIKRCVMHY